MAFRDFWSYDHAAQGTADLSSGTTVASYVENGSYNLYTGLPGMLYKNTNGTGAVTTDGFLTLTTAGGSNPALFLQAKEVQDWSTVTQYWIGFRTKTTAQNGAACNIFALCDTLAQANFAALLQETDMTAAGAAALNTEYYVEVFIDRVNLVYQVWINGVKVKNGVLPAAVLPANGVGFYQWGAYNSQSGVTNGSTRCFRDFYFLDVDATDKGRLGSIRSTLQPLASVSAPNYSAVAASLVGSAGITSTQAKVGSSSFSCGSTAGSGAIVTDRAGLHLAVNFTIEAWCYMTAVNQDVVLLDKSLNSSAGNRSWLEIFNQQVYVKYDGSGGAVAIGPAAGVPGANQWFHLALVKNGSTWTLYINGVSVGTITAAATWGNQAGNLIIGQNFSFSAPNFPGFVDALRISNSARYSANFTPQTTPFTVDSNTVLQMGFESLVNGMLTDDALTALAALQAPIVVNSGSPKIPAMIDAPTLDPMTIGFNTPYSSPTKVLAVDLRAALQTPYPSSSVAAQVSQGGSNVAATVQINDGNLVNSRRVALLRNAPDSGAWTPSKIAATTMIMTPGS